MRRGAAGLVLAGALLAVSLVQAQQASPAAPVSGAAVHKQAAAVDRQRAEVQRLQHDVAAQEAGSHAAADRLRQQDAKITELRQQLQAAQQAGSTAGDGH
ncbi:hypothetical protein [Rhodanobacter sp. PCA2]|uniref:hypothetical protein n=1 Tax=Rhodanobacter sp. PCA2 TaxID=2006117 RepID=UPI0015E6ED09|nr:hypothetical protein [Rhodanobacter sp. PCA2]MBA2078169.1 hypothetical protein [Rhodanobacter sp. PCA2]